MNITVIDDITVSMMMKECLEEAIEDFGKEIKAMTVSPAQKGTFTVDHDSDKLDKTTGGI